MSKTIAGLIEHCKSKLGTPYVFGAKGEILTKTGLDRLARENPGTYTSAYKAKAAKFIDRYCTDCSGLISWYTGRIRGSWDYKESADNVVSINRLDETMIGWALWKPGHIGIYIGNGRCIEAKGINYGTIESKVSDTAWQEVLMLHDIDYTAVPAPEKHYQGFLPAADGKRWWYQFTDGSYARNGWYWLQEVTGGTSAWYLFDAEGYMLTGYRQDPAGEWFFLCPEKGQDEGKCMVTDERGVLIIAEQYDFVNRKYIL